MADMMADKMLNEMADDLDMDVYQDEIYGLIGPNGAGKTTVFNMLTKVYQPTRGTIKVDGQDFALLVGLNVENDESFDEEENVIIAKIVKDENGEDEYVDPTDEEFEAVQKAYNELCDAEEAE